MSAAATAAVKAAIALLSDPKTRKAIGWVIVAILSPVILLVAFLCSLGSGAAQHNNGMMDYCFYSVPYAGDIPAEFADAVASVKSAFSSLDSAVADVNASAEDGGLDLLQLKAIFYVLCSGGEMSTDDFVRCFYTTTNRVSTTTVTNPDGTTTEQTTSYIVNVPSSLETVYANLASALGREITEEEKKTIQQTYSLVAGNGGEGYDGTYLRGSDPSVELDVSTFTNPTTKNAADLVAYAVHAWNSGWGYVWGTYGNILTEDMLDYKLQQYPDGVGQYEDFIRANWLNGRTTDCVGLIKGYGWLDPDTLTIRYGTNGMPDIGANSMYQNATVKGTISIMPDTPGLAVWMDGHIGVYIGGGEVVEASGTRKGVIKTQLEGRGWTHWLEIPYINYG